MEPAGTVHVVEWDGKKQAPKKACDEARKTAPDRFGAPADDVITLVDRRDEGPHVIRHIGLDGGGDQDQRQAGPLETAAQRFGQAEIADRNNAVFDRAPQLIDPFDQRCDHRCSE
jgi:hypothetical protein